MKIEWNFIFLNFIESVYINNSNHEFGNYSLWMNKSNDNVMRGKRGIGNTL